MKILMIGGTGLIGSEAAAELIRRGHEVSTISLPPIPRDAPMPPEMKIELGNFMEMTDDEISHQFAGCKGFVFAAGIDERVEGPPPVYEMFKKFNITALERLLRIARRSGVRHAVICGSYFSYFARSRPELDLARWHPYIRSRIDQEDMAIRYADADFNVAVLELPYIFGVQPGRKPVWVFLVEMIRKMKHITMFPAGGTTMVTVKQVGQAIAGALEKTRGGTCWPIGYYNMTWKEFLTTVHKHMGVPGRKILTIPKWMFVINGRSMLKNNARRGIEGGLNLAKFADLQCSNQFIDKEIGCIPLGVKPDDIDAAIGDSIRLCLEILDGKTDVIDMRG